MDPLRRQRSQVRILSGAPFWRKILGKQGLANWPIQPNTQLYHNGVTQMGRRSGTKHPHLIRRGNVFYARFRVPKRLASKLSIHEICRSLRTPNLRIAKHRATLATLWFSDVVAMLENMADPTRHELEEATRSYFEQLCKELDQPRNFTGDQSGSELDWQIEQS